MKPSRIPNQIAAPNRPALPGKPALPDRPALPGRPATTQPRVGAVQPSAPNYNVQKPIQRGARRQQIRATVGGSHKVAGSVEFTSVGIQKAHISNLKVDQQHRRRGVGSQLIDAAVTAARSQGFRSVSLEARPSDSAITPQALVTMYQRQGFKSVGRSQRGNPLMERKL